MAPGSAKAFRVELLGAGVSAARLLKRLASHLAVRHESHLVPAGVTAVNGSPVKNVDLMSFGKRGSAAIARPAQRSEAETTHQRLERNTGIAPFGS